MQPTKQINSTFTSVIPLKQHKMNTWLKGGNFLLGNTGARNIFWKFWQRYGLMPFFYHRPDTTDDKTEAAEIQNKLNVAHDLMTYKAHSSIWWLHQCNTILCSSSKVLISWQTPKCNPEQTTAGYRAQHQFRIFLETLTGTSRGNIPLNCLYVDIL